MMGAFTNSDRAVGPNGIRPGPVTTIFPRPWRTITRCCLLAIKISPSGAMVCADVPAPMDWMPPAHKAVRMENRAGAGAQARIEYAVAVGPDANNAAELARGWASSFDTTFEIAKSQWEQRRARRLHRRTPSSPASCRRWSPMTPRSGGCITNALVPLLLRRTSFPYCKRCFVTAGPQWAVTLEYFWDTEMWAETWAMLEPATMKEQLTKWLGLNLHGCYAVDCLTGLGAGPWYAANDWSVYRCIEAYIDVTGDTAFLQQQANGKTVLQHLDDIATSYEKRPLTKDTPLADWGGPANLLECSPSYIQGVASLNAASVCMLRRTAEFQEQAGNKNRAQELRAEAEQTAAVAALYEPGQGVWNALDKAGKKVPIRHCFDYIMTSQCSRAT